jgi:hypothetical protein
MKKNGKKWKKMEKREVSRENPGRAMGSAFMGI